MNTAETLAADPTKAITGKLAGLQQLAASGDSEAVQQLDQDDGSTLLIRVRDGEPPVYEAIAPPPVEE